MKNKGFTLAEILIVLVILAFISTITLNATSKSLPDRNKVQFKKAYTQLNKAVGELINDNSLYPKYQSKDPLDPDKYAGFKVSANVVIVPGTEFNNRTDTVQGGMKFPRLLAYKLQAIELNNCPSTTNVCVLKTPGDTEHFYKTNNGSNVGNRVQFETPDGIVWEVGTKTFIAENNNTIIIDVNGDKQPNCRFDDEGCTKPDRFTFIVRYDGSVALSHEKEKEYVSSTKITHDEE